METTSERVSRELAEDAKFLPEFRKMAPSAFELPSEPSPNLKSGAMTARSHPLSTFSNHHSLLMGFCAIHIAALRIAFAESCAMGNH